MQDEQKYAGLLLLVTILVFLTQVGPRIFCLYCHPEVRFGVILYTSRDLIITLPLGYT
jgi:hypothetical protein